jgi:hypothetical protein
VFLVYIIAVLFIVFRSAIYRFHDSVKIKHFCWILNHSGTAYLHTDVYFKRSYISADSFVVPGRLIDLFLPSAHYSLYSARTCISDTSRPYFELTHPFVNSRVSFSVSILKRHSPDSFAISVFSERKN